MSGGPIAVYVLAKRDCVQEWRRLIGPANVCTAKQRFPFSLRAVYGTESTAAPVANAFHGSDSPTAAKREIRFFFPNSKLATAAPPLCSGRSTVSGPVYFKRTFIGDKTV
uniref:Nucleoside diphosphate kinase n=1 Tax=Sipha flava TaxID=143950 RepID=A0A2S2QNG5_9HEMI